MPAKFVGLRKRRTPEHIIADLGVHHVQGFILAEGHTSERFQFDYGYDCLMVTYDEDGYIEPGVVRIQVKALHELISAREGHAFDLDTRDVRLWLMERSLVILILYDASAQRAYWLDVQQWFRDNPAGLPTKGAKSVRVHVPVAQRWNRRSVKLLRQRKMMPYLQLKEAPDGSQN